MDDSSESQSSSDTQASLAANIASHVYFVANGLGKLGAQSESSSVLRAGKEIEKVVNGVTTTGSSATILRDRAIEVSAKHDFRTFMLIL
jgi:hypothetical protein